jgi:hypothetical protein
MLMVHGKEVIKQKTTFKVGANYQFLVQYDPKNETGIQVIIYPFIFTSIISIFPHMLATTIHTYSISNNSRIMCTLKP